MSAAETPGGVCAGCSHFLDDPEEFERELPGLTALSSGYGDTRGDQGICREHRRMALPSMGCPLFERRRG